MFCFQVWLTISLYWEKWSSIHALSEETSALNFFLKSILMDLKVCSSLECFLRFFFFFFLSWEVFVSGYYSFNIYRLSCSPISLYSFCMYPCIHSCLITHDWNSYFLHFEQDKIHISSNKIVNEIQPKSSKTICRWYEICKINISSTLPCCCASLQTVLLLLTGDEISLYPPLLLLQLVCAASSEAPFVTLCVHCSTVCRM